MASLLIPLHEYNPCHNPGGPDGGQFCSTTGGAERTAARPTPIKVKTIEEAVELVLAGKVVELSSTREVNTLLGKLAEMALDAKAKKQDAPFYDLCKVSVAGTNLFCTERFRSERYPDGVPRIKMPQLKAEPVPGSPADQLPREKAGKNTVNAALAFVDNLEASGIKIGKVEEVPAARLKVSQAQLIGAEVARMMTDRTYNPGAEPVFISRDDYILDGHHRWAALVGRDAEDGKLGDVPMNVVRIDAPMSELLLRAKKFTKAFGLKPRGTE